MRARLFALICLLGHALAINLGFGIEAVNSTELIEEGHPVRQLLRHTIAKVLGINRAYSNHSGRKLRLAREPDDDKAKEESAPEIKGAGKLLPFLKDMIDIVPKSGLENEKFVEAFMKDVQENLDKTDSAPKSVLDLLTATHAAMGLQAAQGQTLHFSSPADRALLRRFDVLLRAVRTFEINSYTIHIVNQLDVPVQMLLSNAMSGHRSAWSVRIGKGESVKGEFSIAPIFDLYVVPYVDVTATEFLTMPENSGEDAEAAVMDYGRALALKPGFAGNLYKETGQSLKAESTTYDEKAVELTMKEFKSAAVQRKSTDTQDVGRAKFPTYTKFEATEGKKEEDPEPEGNAKKDTDAKLNDQALIFREVAPANVAERKATLTLMKNPNKDDQIILDGQKMYDGAAQGACLDGEELFWGCCYKQCKQFDGGNNPFRCHFFLCATNEENCDKAPSKAEYGSGGSASGMCRAPGWKSEISMLPKKMEDGEKLD